MAPPVVVLGMHRSGTSALARALRALGVHLGGDAHVTRRNEHDLVQAVNQDLLRAGGGHWSAPPELAPAQWAGLDATDLADRADAALRDLHSGPTGAHGWKDPRNCFTLPWWRSRAGAPLLVITYRHPHEVAASLERRNEFGPGHGFALWEAYNRALFASAQGLPACVVPYAALTADPGTAVERLHAWLIEHGVPLDDDPSGAISAIDPQRRHHVAETMAPEQTTTSQQALWDALVALPARTETLVSPDLGPMHPASRELLEQRRRYLAARDELRQRSVDLRSRKFLARALLRRSVPQRLARGRGEH